MGGKVGSGDKSSRLPGIDGLRGIAAFSILAYHVWFYGAPDASSVDLGPATKVFANLLAGVTLFFVLSGFLIYRAFVASALRDGRLPSVRHYLRNRALRIVPAYLVVLLGVAIVFQHRLLTDPAALTTNLLLLQNYFPAYIHTETDPGLVGIAPAWSLVIEVSFYVALPLLAYMAVRAARRGWSRASAVLVPVVFMFVVGIASKVAARALDPDSSVFAVFQASLPTHADWFAAGMAIAVAHVLWQSGSLRLPARWRVGSFLVAIGLTLGATKLFYSGTLNGLEQQTPIALACALVLAAIVMAPSDDPLLRALNSRTMVALGLVSYSLFLVHDPLVRGLRGWGLTVDGRSGFIVNLALIAALSLVLAGLLYRYVERPALARKRRWHAGDEAGLGSSAPAAQDEGVLPHVQVRLRDAILSVIDQVIGRRAGVLVHVPSSADRLVDRDQIAAVLTPIVENALTYGSAPITIVAESAGDSIRVIVSDAGRGIDSAFQGQLFEPSARSPESARVIAGSGLGLSRARTRARLHGGDVTYEPLTATEARFVATVRCEREEAGVWAAVERDAPPRVNRPGVPVISPFSTARQDGAPSVVLNTP